MEVCKGEGCNRANCETCGEENAGSMECVRVCVDQGGSEHDWGCESSYCTECRVKECQKDWTTCCPVCVRQVAPALVSEVERLRKAQGG